MIVGVVNPTEIEAGWLNEMVMIWLCPLSRDPRPRLPRSLGSERTGARILVDGERFQFLENDGGGEQIAKQIRIISCLSLNRPHTRPPLML